MTTTAGLASAAVVIGGLIAYKCGSERELNLGKEDLIGKQRAVVQTLGAEWFPLRDRIEKEVLEGAASYAGDAIDPDLAGWDFRSAPGIYLRLRVADAKDVPTLRKEAADAKKDAFVACFLRGSLDAVIRGEPDAGVFPEQPRNLGEAYAATRILEDRWLDELKDATDALHLKVFQQQFDKAMREDIPLAVDMVKRAQFFLLVLDEDVPEAAALADGGPITEETLQLVPHPARVYLTNLKTGKQVLRMRRSGEAKVIAAGERPVGDPEIQNAMQRQVNNCALARRIDEAIGQAKR